MPVITDEVPKDGAGLEARGLLPLVRQGVMTPEQIRELVLLTPAHRQDLIDAGIEPFRVALLARYREKVWHYFEESLRDGN
jgi:hypothetical protein